MNRQNRILKRDSIQVKSDADIIDELKEKLHKSFLQISDIEKIYEGQLQSQRESYQAHISNLERQNKQLKAKVQNTTTKLSNEFQTSFEVNGPLFSSQISNTNSFLNDSCIVNWVKTEPPKNIVQHMSLIEKSITETLKIIPKSLYDYFRLTHQVQEENSRIRAQISRLKQENAVNQQFLRNSIRQRKRLQESLQKSKHDNFKIAEMYQQQLTKCRNMQLKMMVPRFERTAKNMKNPEPQSPEIKNNNQQQSTKIKLSSIVSPRSIMRKSQYSVRDKMYVK